MRGPSNSGPAWGFRSMPASACATWLPHLMVGAHPPSPDGEGSPLHLLRNDKGLAVVTAQQGCRFLVLDQGLAAWVERKRPAKGVLDLFGVELVGLQVLLEALEHLASVLVGEG